MNNSNLEFRKIKSLKFLYEINSNGTILRNIKSKKQAKIRLIDNEYIGTVKIHNQYIQVKITNIVAECWLGYKYLGYKYCEIKHKDNNTHNNDYRNLEYIHNNKKPVMIIQDNQMIIQDNQSIKFESYSACSKYISEQTNHNVKRIMNKLNQKRKYIYGYHIRY